MGLRGADGLGSRPREAFCWRLAFCWEFKRSGKRAFQRHDPGTLTISA